MSLAAHQVLTSASPCGHVPDPAGAGVGGALPGRPVTGEPAAAGAGLQVQWPELVDTDHSPIGGWVVIEVEDAGLLDHEVRVLARFPSLRRLPGHARRAQIPGAAWLPAVIFTGVHEFVLAALPDGGTRLTHRESFSGLPARLAKEGPHGGDEGFDAFNQALKPAQRPDRVASSAAGSPLSKVE
jgi:hypothetical protein